MSFVSLGNVVAELVAKTLSAECKGGIINTKHSGQVSHSLYGGCRDRRLADGIAIAGAASGGCAARSTLRWRPRHLMCPGRHQRVRGGSRMKSSSEGHKGRVQKDLATARFCRIRSWVRAFLQGSAIPMTFGGGIRQWLENAVGEKSYQIPPSRLTRQYLRPIKC